MIAFGARAKAWAQAKSIDGYVVADREGFAQALPAIVDARRTGTPQGLFAIIEHPRATLLRAIYRDLDAKAPYDQFLQRLTAFLHGGITLNGKAQDEIEQGLYAPSAPAFEHACLVADTVLFRSRYELELAARLFKSRPKRSAIAAPLDPRVPAPTGKFSPSDDIVIWADDEILGEMGTRMVSDIPLSSSVLRAGTDGGDAAAQTLAAAKAILCMSDDPGTARALARFKRPLCVATPAAHEFLDSVETFDLWDVRGGIDALLRALGGSTPVELGISDAIPVPRQSIPIPSDPPLVSIIMAVYDRLGSLERNLELLGRQTYPHIEIIVVSNNGPRADEICAKFPMVRYIHRPVNSGQAGEPRNDGIAAALGKYVTALDDDDYIFDDHIASMVHMCENGADAVYGNFLIQIVDPNGDELIGYDIEVSTAITAHELLVQNRIGYMTVFARKAVYDSFPVAYDQVNAYGMSELELWLRIARSFVFAKADRPTTLYTIRRGWKGSLTAVEHSNFADGYERMYALYPTPGLAMIEQQRAAHVATLRAQQQSPPREPRYIPSREP